MIFRLAEEKDLPSLLAIEEECFGQEKFGPETLRALIGRQDAFILAAEADGAIVGSTMCLISKETGEGKIASIAILNNSRGGGVGARLLLESEKIMGARGARKVSLEVETVNEPAMSLYLTRGYEIKGIIRNFYSAGRHAYYLEKSLHGML